MQKAKAPKEFGYARDERVTSNAQAAFFRAEAERHRKSAERERVFASLGGAGSGEHEARARHLEAWVAQAESVAAALERSTEGRH